MFRKIYLKFLPKTFGLDNFGFSRFAYLPQGIFANFFIAFESPRVEDSDKKKIKSLSLLVLKLH